TPFLPCMSISFGIQPPISIASRSVHPAPRAAAGARSPAVFRVRSRRVGLRCADRPARRRPFPTVPLSALQKAPEAGGFVDTNDLCYAGVLQHSPRAAQQGPAAFPPCRHPNGEV